MSKDLWKYKCRGKMKEYFPIFISLFAFLIQVYKWKNCLKYGEIHINSSSQIHNSKRWCGNLIIHFFFQFNKSLQIHLLVCWKRKPPQQGGLPFVLPWTVCIYICGGGVFFCISYCLHLVLCVIHHTLNPHLLCHLLSPYTLSEPCSSLKLPLSAWF